MSGSEVALLLVEDNPDDRELALIALKSVRVPIKVEVARDGEEALNFLFCRGPFAERSFDFPPRLVLLDLKLPKVHGLEVLKAVKMDPRTKAIPVVVMTSSREERDMVEGYLSGANSYIQKPVDFTEFRDLIDRLGNYWLTINQAPPRDAFLAKP